MAHQPTSISHITAHRHAPSHPDDDRLVTPLWRANAPHVEYGRGGRGRMLQGYGRRGAIGPVASDRGQAGAYA